MMAWLPALPGQRASPLFEGQDGRNDAAENQERGGVGFGRFWPFLPFKLSDVSPSQAALLARERAAELQKLQETAEQAEACCVPS